MTKEFHYFNINATAETVRYILHYTKKLFKDVRHDISTWPNQRTKEMLPYDQFPLYKEEDGRTLTQSLAIAKYVARDSDLIPEDPWKQAVLDSEVFTIYDYWNHVKAYILEKDLDKKYELKKQLIEETIDYFFARFDNHLKENGGFFAGALSWAEFVLCAIVESTELFLEIELKSKYPMVAAVVELIRSLPGVKEYIENREPYELHSGTTKYKGMSILDRKGNLFF